MADTTNKTVENQEISQSTDTPENLQKSLDEQLKNVEELLKAKKSDDDYEEKMKDPKWRAKMKKLMKDHEGEEDEDEDEEGEDDKGKFKKSIDDAVEENEEIFDAVPILKSFAKIVGGLADEVKELKKSVEDTNKIQKSVADVIVAESKLMKSFQEDIEKIAKTPLPKKGVVTQDQILNKSFGNEETKKQYNLGIVKDILIKSVQSNTLDGLEVCRWEQNGYRMETLSPKALAILENNLSKKGGNV